VLSSVAPNLKLRAAASVLAAKAHPSAGPSMSVDSKGFYERVPVFDRFTGIVDPSRYQPLPDD